MWEASLGGNKYLCTHVGGKPDQIIYIQIVQLLPYNNSYTYLALIVQPRLYLYKPYIWMNQKFIPTFIIQNSKDLTLHCFNYLVSDCLPVPPTPTSRAFPRSWRIMRAIRETCSMASRKNTSFISLEEFMLKSSRYCKRQSQRVRGQKDKRNITVCLITRPDTIPSIIPYFYHSFFNITNQLYWK